MWAGEPLQWAFHAQPGGSPPGTYRFWITLRRPVLAPDLTQATTDLTHGCPGEEGGLHGGQEVVRASRRGLHLVERGGNARPVLTLAVGDYALDLPLHRLLVDAHDRHRHVFLDPVLVHTDHRALAGRDSQLPLV